MTGTKGDVVVAIDFSDNSRRALDVACDLAARSGAQLHVVHALPEPGKRTRGIDRDKVLSALATVIEDAVTAAEVPEERVHAVVRSGDAEEIVVTLADEVGASLTVVGMRGSDALEELFLGSVANKLARLSSTPLLIVTPDAPTPFVARNVVVGMDLSAESKELALHAACFVASEGALHLLNVYETIGIYETSTITPNLPSSSWDRQQVENARAELDATVESLGDDTTATIQTYVRPGLAAGELLALGEKLGAELVVVGSHGRRGLNRLLLGNTAERVLRRGSSSVLVVRKSARSD